MKVCKKCLVEKPKSEFYGHQKTTDRLQGKCKECSKSLAIANRLAKLDHYREYDRIRGNRLPDGYQQEYRSEFPNKYRAHTMVGNAIKAGNLFKEPCEECGSDDSLHAHHDDYAKPLNVRWLCAAHHRQWHVANGEAANP